MIFSQRLVECKSIECTPEEDMGLQKACGHCPTRGWGLHPTPLWYRYWYQNSTKPVGRPPFTLPAASQPALHCLRHDMSTVAGEGGALRQPGRQAGRARCRMPPTRCSASTPPTSAACVPDSVREQPPPNPLGCAAHPHLPLPPPPRQLLQLLPWEQQHCNALAPPPLSPLPRLRGRALVWPAALPAQQAPPWMQMQRPPPAPAAATAAPQAPPPAAAALLLLQPLARRPAAAPAPDVAGAAAAAASWGLPTQRAPPCPQRPHCCAAGCDRSLPCAPSSPPHLPPQLPSCRAGQGRGTGRKQGQGSEGAG